MFTLKKLFFLILALACVFLYATSTDVNCTRQLDGSYTCHLRTLLFGKLLIRERRAENVTDIVIRTFERVSKPHYETYSAEFVTRNGDHVPIEGIRITSTKFGRIQEAVNNIGFQMSSNEALIYYRVNRTWDEYIVLSVFVAILSYAFVDSGRKK